MNYAPFLGRLQLAQAIPYDPSRATPTPQPVALPQPAKENWLLPESPKANVKNGLLALPVTGIMLYRGFTGKNKNTRMGGKILGGLAGAASIFYFIRAAIQQRSQ